MNYLRPLKFRNDLLADLSSNLQHMLSAFDGFPEESTVLATWFPKIDIKEENNQYIIYADVPGIDPEKIDVTVDNGILTIKGSKESEKKEEKENYLRVERSSGSFMRQMSLPSAVDSNKVKAKCVNGVLNIILPKIEQTNGKKIPIEK